MNMYISGTKTWQKEYMHSLKYSCMHYIHEYTFTKCLFVTQLRKTSCFITRLLDKIRVCLIGLCALKNIRYAFSYV